MRPGHELVYFEGKGNSYVFLASAENEKDYIEDYGDKYEHNASLAELLIRFIGRATEWVDEDYLFKMAGVLEKKLNVKRKPRKYFGKILIDGVKMKKKKIIHKCLFKENEIHYLCNQAVNASWLKTDITNEQVTCKNCLKIHNKKLKLAEDNGYRRL